MLQGVGLSGLTAFASLYFAMRGWGHAGLVMTAFGIGFILMRIVFGHLPDRIGGMRSSTRCRVGRWALRGGWSADAHQRVVCTRQAGHDGLGPAP